MRSDLTVTAGFEDGGDRESQSAGGLSKLEETRTQDLPPKLPG